MDKTHIAFESKDGYLFGYVDKTVLTKFIGEEISCSVTVIPAKQPKG